MKRILALGMGTIVALPLITATLVFAEGGTPGTSGTSGTGYTGTTTETKPTGTDDSQAMQTRIEQRKTELKIRLASNEKLSIQAKCKSAQGNVSSIKGRVKGIETSRSEAYGNIVTRLTELSVKLKNKGADTKALDAAIVNLQAKITTFNTDLATYRQDVSDLAGMDCKTDPDGFKAALQASRTAQERVAKDAAAVKAQVNDVIKPLLKTIRDGLDAAKTGGNR